MVSETENKSARKRVAIMGTRGIPARYGGFETFAAELSARLVTAGFAVTVFSRHSLAGKRQNGTVGAVQVRSSFTVFHKYLETPLATISSFLQLFVRRFDIIILCNAANSPFAWLPRLLGIPVLINVDGIERERGKWNALGRAWYRLGEYCSVLFASRVIADAKVIQKYYQEQYRCDSTVIAYGATTEECEPGAVLQQWNLEKDQYILYVSRLEPENNALGVIQAYVQTDISMPLVIVGDAPYADEYKEALRAAANEKVVFTGFQFDKAYRELRTNCFMYVQATEVGGTHPALVEAMGYGNCIIANKTPENLEVLGEAGVYYEKNDFNQLADVLQSLVENQERVLTLRDAAKKRAHTNYSWEAVTKQYVTLINDFL